MSANELLELLMNYSDLNYKSTSLYYKFFSKENLLREINFTEIKIAKLYKKRKDYHNAVYYWRNIIKSPYTTFEYKVKIRVNLALYNDDYDQLFKFFLKTAYINELIQYYYEVFKYPKVIKLGENYLSFNPTYNLYVYHILAKSYLLHHNYTKACEYYTNIVFNGATNIKMLNPYITTYVLIYQYLHNTTFEEILKGVLIKHPKFKTTEEYTCLLNLDQTVVNLNVVNDVIKSSENSEFLYYLSLK